MVLFEKYRLGPADSNFASVTFPDESTSTLMRTLILPSIVRRALGETSGNTCCTTAPWGEPAEEFFSGAPERPAGRAALFGRT
jgi:hypothetical protein